MRHLELSRFTREGVRLIPDVARMHELEK